MNAISVVLLRTDWKQMAIQKEFLHRLSLDGEQAAEGLLNWIDVIQDAIIADKLIPESTVFPKRSK